jgi:hypothetical protein
VWRPALVICLQKACPWGAFFEGHAEAQGGPIKQDATALLPQLISARERFAADLSTGMPIRFGVASQGQIRES